MTPFIPFKTFSERKFFGSLDGLRALSIIGVVFFHTCPVPKEWGLLGTGWAGVDLFFAISGFLITTLLLRERARNGKISIKGFYWRRTLRIFPLYFATLFLYVLVVTFVEKDPAAKEHFYGNLKYFLTYTANWFVDPGTGRVHFGFAWSLSTEEQFYLVWPSLMVLFPNRAVRALSAIITVVIIAKSGLLEGLLPALPLKILTSVSIAICLGVVWAWLLNQERFFTPIYKVLGHKASAPVMFALTALVLHFHLPDLVKELCFSLCVVSCVVREDHGLAAGTTWKPVAYIGTISYGVYLLHMLCANVVTKVFPIAQEIQVLKFIGTMVVVTVVATVSFRTYEAFFLKFKDRVR